MTPDEAAEKELCGMAHSSIKEEKDELASNKSELDLKVQVDESTFSSASEVSSEHD